MGGSSRKPRKTDLSVVAWELDDGTHVHVTTKQGAVYCIVSTPDGEGIVMEPLPSGQHDFEDDEDGE